MDIANTVQYYDKSAILLSDNML